MNAGLRGSGAAHQRGYPLSPPAEAKSGSAREGTDRSPREAPSVRCMFAACVRDFNEAFWESQSHAQVFLPPYVGWVVEAKSVCSYSVDPQNIP
jgi:hypothetical protein